MTKPPIKWKMAVVVWIALYPTITTLFMLFGDWLAKLTPLPLQTLITTLIIVPLMVFFIMPFLEGVLSDWLRK